MNVYELRMPQREVRISHGVSLPRGVNFPMCEPTVILK